MTDIGSKLLFSMLALSVSGLAQVDSSRQVFAYRPDQEVRLQNVALPPSSGTDPHASTIAMLTAVFNDPEVCCGADSALRSELDHLDSNSLQAISDKLKGRHLIKGSRWITVESNYLAEPNITPAQLVEPVKHGQTVLLEWNRRLYLLKAVSFDEMQYSDGTSDYVIRRLVLLDPLSKTKNHEVSFDRQKDDWGNIKGLLRLTARKDPDL